MTQKFTTPCFIRRNTAELRKKLSDLGYTDETIRGKSHKGTCLSVSRDGYWNHGDADMVTNDGSFGIDCGTNEGLFLALAALKSDTDVTQWFVMDVEVYVNIPKGTWFKATDMSGGRHIGTQIEPLYCHKATVKEIIEHFNTDL